MKTVFRSQTVVLPAIETMTAEQRFLDGFITVLWTFEETIGPFMKISLPFSCSRLSLIYQ